MHVTKSLPSTSSPGGGAVVVAGLHFGFQSDLVLFSQFRLNSWASFVFACAFTSLICLSERFITFLLTSRAHPTRWQSPSATKVAVYRTVLYAAGTTLRLAYMLLSMTLHVGIILVIVISLSAGQLFIELRGLGSSSTSSKGSVYQPIPEDVESPHGSWDGAREARDKARQIMMGTFPHSRSTSTSGPLSSQVHQSHFSRTSSRSSQQRFLQHHQKRDSVVRFQDAAPVHRRQNSSTNTSPVQPYQGGVGSSGSLYRGGYGSGRSTPTNGPRKPIFQIGSTDEGGTTTDSE